MLFAAFHNSPTGTLRYQAATPEVYLSGYAQVSLEVAKANAAILTAGWKVSRGRLTFEPMSEMAKSLHESYPEALKKMQYSAALAITAPDLFGSDLMPTHGADLAAKVGESTLKAADKLRDSKIQKELPENAQISNEIRDVMLQHGFKQERHDEVWERFTDYCRSFQFKAASWKARFRIWLQGQVRNGAIVPCSDSTKSQNKSQATFNNPSRAKFNFRPGAAGERAQQAADTTSDRLSAAQESLRKARQRQANNL